MGLMADSNSHSQGQTPARKTERTVFETKDIELGGLLPDDEKLRLPHGPRGDRESQQEACVAGQGDALSCGPIAWGPRVGAGLWPLVRGPCCEVLLLFCEQTQQTPLRGHSLQGPEQGQGQEQTWNDCPGLWAYE